MVVSIWLAPAWGRAGWGGPVAQGRAQPRSRLGAFGRMGPLLLPVYMAQVVVPKNATQRRPEARYSIQTGARFYPIAKYFQGIFKNGLS